MEYIYTAKGTTFTEAMKKDVEKHFKKLEESLKGPIKCNLIYEPDGFEMKAQVITKSNRRIRADMYGRDFYDLVTGVRDNLENQLEKHKLRMQDKRIEETYNTQEIDSPYPIVKYKVLEAEPMTEFLAIQNMEALGHDFYIFKNMNMSNSICVVYRRLEEDYGIINLI